MPFPSSKGSSHWHTNLIGSGHVSQSILRWASAMIQGTSQLPRRVGHSLVARRQQGLQSTLGKRNECLHFPLTWFFCRNVLVGGASRKLHFAPWSWSSHGQSSISSDFFLHPFTRSSSPPSPPPLLPVTLSPLSFPFPENQVLYPCFLLLSIPDLRTFPF